MDIFRNLDVLINEYGMSPEQSNHFIELVSDLPEKKLKNVIATFGSKLFGDEESKKEFLKSVIGEEKQTPENELEANSIVVGIADGMTLEESMAHAKDNTGRGK